MHIAAENIADLQNGPAYFVTFVSATPDLSVTQMFKHKKGMIIEFDASVLAHKDIFKAYVGWISEFGEEKELLFARSSLVFKNKIAVNVGLQASLVHYNN